MVRLLLTLFIFLILPVIVSAGAYFVSEKQDHWRTADRSASGLSPDPGAFDGAIVQVFSSRAYRWRGIFAVHSWITVKPKGAKDYLRFDVMGWGAPLRVNAFAPDGRWFGRDPDVIFDVRGERAEAMISDIVDAVRDYPYQNNGNYVLWPGPNSNTFVAWVARQVPAFDVHLSPLAVGKDFGEKWFSVMPTPSNTGWQVSIRGFAGLGIGWIEGLELHVLGSTLGLDLRRPAIKLPGLGRIGMPQAV